MDNSVVKSTELEVTPSAQGVSDAPTKPDPKQRKSMLRLMLLAVVMLSAIAAVYFSPLRGWLENKELVHQTLDRLGIWGYPACALAVALLVAAGIPRLVFCAICGMAFGFWPGLMVVQTGSLLGYYGLFLFVRWGGREFVLSHWPKLQTWGDMIDSQGVMGVILIRQLPLPGTITNFVLGLSKLRHRYFLLGTIVGIFPEAIPLVLFGAGIVKHDPKDTVGYIAIAVLCMATLWLVGGYAMKRLKSSRKGMDLMDKVSSLEGVGN